MYTVATLPTAVDYSAVVCLTGPMGNDLGTGPRHLRQKRDLARRGASRFELVENAERACP